MRRVTLCLDRDRRRIALGGVCGACLTLNASRAECQLRRASDRPVVRIDAQLDTAAEFNRITAAYQLPNGQLAVADARLRSVRVFGTDGRFLRNLGRAGGGPGEFNSVMLLPPAGDTILVWDSPQRRITRYSLDGHLIGTLRVLAADNASRIYVVGRLASGRWLVATPYTPSLMRPGGTFDDSIRVGTIAVTADGAVAWLGWFPGATFWVWKPNASADHGESVGIARLSAPTLVLANGDDVIVASGGTNNVILLDERGQRRGRFGVAGKRQPIPESPRAKARAAAIAEARSDRDRANIEASFERSALPSVAPAFDNIAVYGDEIWLRLFNADVSASTHYSVFRLDGSALGDVVFPPRARVVDVGRDYAWVAVADSDGVERLEKYALRR